jgi:hypothetical protein
LKTGAKERILEMNSYKKTPLSKMGLENGESLDT